VTASGNDIVINIMKTLKFDAHCKSAALKNMHPGSHFIPKEYVVL